MKNVEQLKTLSDKESVFDIQIKFLSEEYTMIQNEISELNKKSQNCRNWTVTLWAGSIAISINPQTSVISQFIFISAIFPLMFWLQDTAWTQIQRVFIYRSKGITDFYNSDNLVKSKAAGRIIGFDISGFRKSYSVEIFDDTEFKKFCSFWKVLLFPTKTRFYPVLAIFSIALHIFLNYI